MYCFSSYTDCVLVTSTCNMSHTVTFKTPNWWWYIGSHFKVIICHLHFF
nr:unnamed protein product [Callosobruchus analis]